MTNPNAHYFDLDSAIELSDRMLLNRKQSVSNTHDSQTKSSKYIQFVWDKKVSGKSLKIKESALDTFKTEKTDAYARISVKENIAEPEKAIETTSENIAIPENFHTLDDFLGWGLKLVNAQAAFVVDHQGFVIAQYGQIPSEGIDGLGAELCFAVEQMKRVNANASKLNWLDMEFDNLHLIAVIDETIDSGEFIVSFYGTRISIESQKSILIKTLAKNKLDLM
jgi:hypothetical protein